MTKLRCYMAALALAGVTGCGAGASVSPPSEAPTAAQGTAAPLSATARTNVLPRATKTIEIEEVCPAAGNRPRCQMLAMKQAPTGDVTPLGGGLGGGQFAVGWGALDLQSAYGISAEGTRAETVGIVSYGGDLTLESDLATYRASYALPPCTISSGCLKIVGTNGGPPPSTTDTSTVRETSLDVDMVSAGCPNCKIVVVLLGTGDTLDAGMQQAINQGARAISTSWGNPEFNQNEDSPTSIFNNHPGVEIFVASGDSPDPSPPQQMWPAVMPGVIAVGGTMLNKNSDPAPARGWVESAWLQNINGVMYGTQAGCSAFAHKPAWQHDTICPTKRTVADVSAVAEYVASYNPVNQWESVGGTSAAAPLVAAIYAGSGNLGADGELAYDEPGAFNDITSGNVVWSASAPCQSGPGCVAQAGYDAPTGIGTPWVPTFRRNLAASTSGQSAALSANPNEMDVLYIGKVGNVMDANWTSTGGWVNSQIAIGGQATANSHIAAAARNPTQRDVFWIAGDGSVQFAWRQDAVPYWFTQTLYGAGTASPTGAITAVSRLPNTEDVFFVGPNGQVEQASYNGTSWTLATLPAAQSAYGGMAVVSRIPNSFELFYIGTDNSIQDLYFYDGSGWQSQTLASGSASHAWAWSNITVASPSPDGMEVWWVGVDGSIQNKNYYENRGWTGYQLYGANTSEKYSAIQATSRMNGQFDLFYEGTGGNFMTSYYNAGWGSSSLSANGIMNQLGYVSAVPRRSNTLETFYSQTNKQLTDAYWYTSWNTQLLEPANSTAN